MAGHSKWANIRYRKNAQDAKKGKIFSKLIREISVAARMNGGDEGTNPRLRDAVTKALKANMRRDTIDNAIKRGVKGLDHEHMVEVRYEGHGPGGVAVLVDCFTDRKNRTVSEVRHAFTKHGGALGTDGSVAYLFEQKGEILLANNHNADPIIDLAIDAGAIDIEIEQKHIVIITTPDLFSPILTSLENTNFAIEHAEITMLAKLDVPVSPETKEQLLKLITALEDLDDVVDVFTNAVFAAPQ